MKTESKTRRSRTPKGRDSKGKILDMAEKIFSQKGFVASSVSDVVKGLGISAGALYHHFPSKQDLLVGIAQRSMKQLCDKMDAWVQDEQMSPGEKVDRFLDEIDDRRHLRIILTKVDLKMATEDREIHEQVVQAGLEPLSERLSVFIQKGNESGEFKVARPRSTAIIIVLIMSEFMHRSHRIETMAPLEEFEPTVRESINALLGRS